jgi:CHAD domain-containing protein
MQSSPAQAKPAALPARVNLALAQLRTKPDEDKAHLFRTTYRRFQVWLKRADVAPNKEQAEAIAYLDKVLKRAGKLRDAGLHLKMLKEMKLPDQQKPKAKLKSRLEKRYEKRQERLRDLLESASLSDVRQALSIIEDKGDTTRPKASGEQGKELQELLNRYASSVHARGVLSKENLHEYRLTCKEFRYEAELIGGAEADDQVKQFKRVQDAIGEWHDWLVLSELAQKELKKGPLSRSITSIEARKLARALRVAEATESKLLEAGAPPVERKPVQRSATHRPERASARSA